MSASLYNRSRATGGEKEAADLAVPGVLKERPAPVGLDVLPAPVVLVADGLSVTYDGCNAPALDGISFVLREGETIALVGPSGGGKTTLLRALEESVKATGGSVELDGKTALVYQDLRLVPEQTVLSNVCSGALGEIGFAGGIFGFPKHIQERALGLLEDLGLQSYANSKVCCLSGGQRQRVAIARALCAGPRILLADEPMASLDPQNSERILALLSSLQKKYRFALVLSIHDPGPDPGFFQRYFVIRDGLIKLETSDADAAWDSFKYCATKIADGECGGKLCAQDRGLETANSAMKMVRYAFFALATLLVLGWSARALNLSGAAFAGAFQSVFQFLSKIVPGSAAEVQALPWATLGASLVETIQMAIWGTAIGIVISLPLAVLASRETAPRAIRYPVRFLLNTIRTIPSIFWALVFVAFVGLGPLAGVFALAAYSVGYLTKFFYEGLEDADDRPASALRALGASRLQIFFRAILPAARPVLAGSCLFVFEYNIRSASVLGVVGAGGIGQDLMYYIEWRNFPAAAAGLLMILAVVVALDTVSHVWRRKLSRDRGA